MDLEAVAASEVEAVELPLAEGTMEMEAMMDGVDGVAAVTIIGT